MLHKSYQYLLFAAMLIAPLLAQATPGFYGPRCGDNMLEWSLNCWVFVIVMAPHIAVLAVLVLLLAIIGTVWVIRKQRQRRRTGYVGPVSDSASE